MSIFHFAYGTLSIFLLQVASIQYSHSQEISPGVRINPGPVNGVLIEKDGRRLAVYGDPTGKINKADMVLFTDFRRDVIWAGKRLVRKGALAVAPHAQRDYFAHPDSLWRRFTLTRFHDYTNQTTKIGIAPFNVHRFVNGGETLKWQDVDIKVLNTTGYTRGSVSYIADIDSKRFAFTGDLIYGDGKLLDLYSFQDSLPGIDGYHGYAARLGQLISSLQLVASENPDFIIPSRGPVIDDPDTAIQKLIERIRLLYRNYLSITAQRWNHTDRMITLSTHVLGLPNGADWMPFSLFIEGIPGQARESPSWYTHIGSSKLVWSEDSAAFLVDCGSENVIETLKKLKTSGRLKNLDGIFITHYHDDHTDFVNDAVEEFGCPVYVTQELKDILERPGAYRMPCLTRNPIANLTIMEEGEKLSWKDFMLTFFYFPGQTLYHDGLLMEKNNGEAVFFTGDSFTPAGIDDYCFQNRNLLHEGMGYLYCLDVLRKLPANTLLSNQHIKPLFRFSPQQLDHMSDVLRERNALIKELLPWDDVNYGTDDQWVSLYPYGQKAMAGETITCTVKIFNHSKLEKTFTVKPNLPDGFRTKSKTFSMSIPPRTEGTRTFNVRIPKGAEPGVSLLLVDIKFDDWDLREWGEGFVEVNRGTPNCIQNVE